MYEPKYLPQLTEKISTFPGMSFSIVYNNKYRKIDDPDTDPLHVHNYLEIFLNISSDISFHVNNNLYSVSAGNAVISCPGDIHMGIFHKSSVHEHICIWVDANFTAPIFFFCARRTFVLHSPLTRKQKRNYSLLLYRYLTHAKREAQSLKNYHICSEF